jgi:glutamate synthase (NADPH/NADH) small chain
VAIVGSGPAGLCAAAQLNRAGHEVSVFEREDRPGGLLMYGIPNMKLDKQLVHRRIDLLAKEGVQFITRTEVGRHYPAQRLLLDFDAAVLCTGATQPRDLPVEGRHLEGIHFAMDFLTANTRQLLNGHKDGSYICATGKDVVIVGGGDTGTDCVGTALRHGCRCLLQIEILPRPPQERAPDNPWPEWPKVYRLDYGQEEAAALFGADPRLYLTTVKKFIGDSQGRVKELVTVQIRWDKDADGPYVPREVPGSEQVRPAQLVLLAMGFLGPEQPLLDQLKIERDARTNVKAEHGQYATNLKGLFAAGDCRRGQSLVVWAFHEGRGVARAVDRYLMGGTDLP